MFGIVTKVLPATNTQGTRVQAVGYEGKVIVPWDYSADAATNHRQAAIRFMDRHGKFAPNYLSSAYVRDGMWCHLG